MSCDSRSSVSSPGGIQDCPLSRHLDYDGLTMYRDPVQHRLRQLDAHHQAEVESLRRQVRELKLRLQARQETGWCGGEELVSGGGSGASWEVSSQRESLGSHSGVGSAPGGSGSDVSWEAVEEKDSMPTLWVPDHASHRCHRCDSAFWVAKRRHHCRSCGKVFCAECASHQVPLPTEQLFDPVRVCTSCYTNLLKTMPTSNGADISS